jgi:hypothetical protein
MKMTGTRAWSAIVIMWWMAGCGPSGGSANLGGFSSSVDGKTQLGQLTPQQQQTLCGEFMSFARSSGLYQDTRDLFCRDGAILGASITVPDGAPDDQLRAACRTSYALCTASPAQEQCNFAMDPTCTATVAEASACINDSFQAFKMALDSTPTCDQITVATLQSSGPPTPPTPPSCVTYMQKCPNQPMM